MRCGTGAVHHALGSHPGIHASDRKEIRFFDVRYGNGEAWYRRHFPTDTQARALEEQTGRSLPIGESTPAYVFHPAVPARLKRMVPDARLVVLVREPVARAVSHYHLAVRKRWEDLSFEEAIEREPERLAGVEERQLADPEFRSAAHRHLSYVLAWPLRTAARALAGAVSRGADPGPEERGPLRRTGPRARRDLRVHRGAAAAGSAARVGDPQPEDQRSRRRPCPARGALRRAECTALRAPRPRSRLVSRR